MYKDKLHASLSGIRCTNIEIDLSAKKKNFQASKAPKTDYLGSMRQIERNNMNIKILKLDDIIFEL